MPHIYDNGINNGNNNLTQKANEEAVETDNELTKQDRMLGENLLKVQYFDLYFKFYTNYTLIFFLFQIPITVLTSEQDILSF